MGFELPKFLRKFKQNEKFCLIPFEMGECVSLLKKEAKRREKEAAPALHSDVRRSYHSVEIKEFYSRTLLTKIS